MGKRDCHALTNINFLLKVVMEMPQLTLTKLGMAQRHALQSLGKQDGLFMQKMTTKDVFAISLVKEKLTVNRNQKMMITRVKMNQRVRRMTLVKMIQRVRRMTLVKMNQRVTMIQRVTSKVKSIYPMSLILLRNSMKFGKTHTTVKMKNQEPNTRLTDLLIISKRN